MTNLTGSILYTTNGADPRLPFTGAVAPDALEFDPAHPPVLGRDIDLRARSLDGTNWSAISEASLQVEALGLPIRFTEVMYNPPGGDAYEFIELSNVGGVAVDLAGFSTEGVEFRFPEPYPPLQPGDRLVLASATDPAAFAARYPGVTVGAWYNGALNNGGERLALLDRTGRVVASVEYDDDRAWPTSPDGSGTSLELGSADGEEDDPANWHASAAPGGTPGAANSRPLLPEVRLNEIYAAGEGGVGAAAGAESDWLECQRRRDRCRSGRLELAG